ncbi:MAG: PEP-CTERM sorting domain-containing protein [Planctomycetes bacterium]|nr:PEP-CTERM sorting domain-containing protein [Planctomycetota bacterium]
MRRTVLASFVALSAFSGTAFADIAFPSFYTAGTLSAPGGYVGAPVNGGLNAVDGTLIGFQLSNPATVYTITMTVQFDLSAAHFPADYPTVVLHGFQFSSSYTAQLTGLTWSTNGAGAITTSAPLAQTLASGDTIKIDGSLFTGLIGATVNQLDITFTVNTGAAGGQNFLLDAVSNPEPGTMALFGLGAMGLGGFAWRRRKAKKAAAKA